MNSINGIRVSIPIKGAFDKVTGVVRYTDYIISPGMLHAKILTSSYAHAKVI